MAGQGKLRRTNPKAALPPDGWASPVCATGYPNTARDQKFAYVHTLLPKSAFISYDMKRRSIMQTNAKEKLW